MNALMIIVGPDADHNLYLMDLASVAAGLAIESGRRILFTGTSQAILSVGTALVGYQQGRTVEEGERLPSPMVLAGVIRSDIDTPDPLYRKTELEEKRPHPEGGMLSELIDFGVMDLDIGMEKRIIPKPIEELDLQLKHLLRREKPSQTLIIGSVSEEMLDFLSNHAKESNMHLGVVKNGYVPQGVEALSCEVGEPKLDGVPIGGVELSKEKFRGETVSESLIEAANNAVWEAGLSHAVTVWVKGKGQNPF